MNPSFEAVRMLPDQIAGAEIVKKELPTVYKDSAVELEEAILAVRPDLIISVGQAGGQKDLTPEKVAINLAEARIPDNSGAQPMDQPLREDGDTAYFATVPVKAMVQRMKQHGIPASISYSAGTFVCNAVMYQARYLIEKKYPGIRSGFIHVPYATEQLGERSSELPCLPLAEIARGLGYAIEAAIEGSEVAMTGGTIF